MKFWLNTKTNEQIRLGEWKDMYNLEHRIPYADNDAGRMKLNEFIRHKIASSCGSIIYLGEKY